MDFMIIFVFFQFSHHGFDLVTHLMVLLHHNNYGLLNILYSNGSECMVNVINRAVKTAKFAIFINIHPSP